MRIRDWISDVCSSDLPVPAPVLAPVQLPPGGVASAAAQVEPLQPVKGASRCLVIGPEKSASGKVLMMEATADGPEIHLRGGGFDNAGFGSTGWGIPTLGRGAQQDRKSTRLNSS